MEPHNNNYGPSTELPQPIETAEHTSASEQGQAVRPEAPQPHTSPMSTPAPTIPPTPSSPLNSQVINANPVAQQQSSQPANAAMIADDADLIEKEWVIRAKTIVMETKNDPYNQNREMNKVKADYLKKRYNKDLKISEN